LRPASSGQMQNGMRPMIFKERWRAASGPHGAWIIPRRLQNTTPPGGV
jgi:hypothetical protein